MEKHDHLEPHDIEYLQLLRQMKPYVTSIMDNNYIILIKLWLEKLGTEPDKATRNSYLRDLSGQIKKGQLVPPFSLPPPIAQLRPKLVRRRKQRRKFIRETVPTDDGSWYDMSDDEGASGDVSKEQDSSQVEELLSTIEELKRENSELSTSLEMLQQDGRNGEVTNEVQVLKDKLNEVLELKQALQESHMCVAAEWQSMVGSLHNQLKTMHRQNCEYQTSIEMLKRKLSEAQQCPPMVPHKCATLSELYRKEVDKLRQSHEQAIEENERNYLQIIETKTFEYNDKVEEMRGWYENRLAEVQKETDKAARAYYDKHIAKLRAELEDNMQVYCSDRDAEKEKAVEEFKVLKCEHEDTLREECERRIEEIRCEYEKEGRYKDAEIERLEVLLQEQCGRMQQEVQTIRNQLEVNVAEASNESRDEKIEFLKKCVMKLSKLYQRAEKEFDKQIKKLRKEMDLREKKYQILLSTERLKMVSDSTVERQKEVDGVVDRLEGRYKNILIQQQQEYCEERKALQDQVADLRIRLSMAPKAA